MINWNKYLVLKTEDIDKMCETQPDFKKILEVMINNIAALRYLSYKKNKRYIVISEDNPLFEETKEKMEKLIETTVHG